MPEQVVADYKTDYGGYSLQGDGTVDKPYDVSRLDPEAIIANGIDTAQYMPNNTVFVNYRGQTYTVDYHGRIAPVGQIAVANNKDYLLLINASDDIRTHIEPIAPNKRELKKAPRISGFTPLRNIQPKKILHDIRQSIANVIKPAPTPKK